MTKLLDRRKMYISKETKGTYVFSDEAEDAPIRTIYIRKSAFDGREKPMSITVTID